MKLEIHYAVEIDDTQKRRMLSQAEEFGLSYADAGPIEMLTRLLIHNGIECVEESQMEALNAQRIK